MTNPHFYVTSEIMWAATSDYVLFLKIEEIDTVKETYFNPEKVGYDTFEYFNYCATEYDLFKLIVNFMKHKNLIGFLEGETELDDITKLYIAKFLSSYDDYPELII